MGDSFTVIMTCHARDVRRRFNISDSGKEVIIWIFSSFGRLRNSASNEVLIK